MIQIHVTKKGKDFKEIKIEGHASPEFGKRGENILCASVSALSQTLLIFLLQENLVDKYDIDNTKGFLWIKAKEKLLYQYMINKSFELIITGLQTIQAQYSNEVSIVY